MQFCGMLHRLKDKWKVSWPRFALIFVTFALGGSLCGYLGRKLLQMLAIDGGVLKVVVYIILVTLLWPFCVLIISIPLGQFGFFRSYLRKMGGRMLGKSNVKSQKSEVKSDESNLRQRATGDRRPKEDDLSMVNEPRTTNNEQRATNNIAIFASGAGSNARRIIEYFRGSTAARVSLIVCNNPKAGVLQVAADHDLPVLMLNRKGFIENSHCLEELRLHNIHFIVLAGFLWKIPGYLVAAYPGRIINIHPALLPKYGGKGMYGNNVHQAVIDAGEKESGITIHYVDEHYDNGDIIFQAKCAVLADDTAASLAQRIHALEHEHFPGVIEDVLTNKITTRK